MGVSCCPHCGGEIIVALRAAPVARAEPIVDEFLEPCRLADRLGLSEAYVRRLCSRGHKVDEPGIQRNGGRWFATIETIDRLRRVSGAF